MPVRGQCRKVAGDCPGTELKPYVSAEIIEKFAMSINRPKTCSATEGARTGIEIARDQYSADSDSVSSMHCNAGKALLSRAMIELMRSSRRYIASRHQ